MTMITKKYDKKRVGTRVSYILYTAIDAPESQNCFGARTYSF